MLLLVTVAEGIDKPGLEALKHNRTPVRKMLRRSYSNLR